MGNKAGQVVHPHVGPQRRSDLKRACQGDIRPEEGFQQLQLLPTGHRAALELVPGKGLRHLPVKGQGHIGSLHFQVSRPRVWGARQLGCRIGGKRYTVLYASRRAFGLDPFRLTGDVPEPRLGNRVAINLAACQPMMANGIPDQQPFDGRQPLCCLPIAPLPKQNGYAIELALNLRPVHA